MTLGVAIPAYKDAARLARCLQSIAEYAPELLEHTVVVDDSGDGQVRAALKVDYSQIKWIVHSSNAGFGASATEAVRACDADIVILLNDDVQILNDPTSALLSCFQDASLFAVSFRSESLAGQFREGAKRLVWRLGFPKILHNPVDQVMKSDAAQASSYAVGGHCAYRKRFFDELGGFDKLFDPFYWEDVDLSMRALRHGWMVQYQPECRVRHEEAGAIKASHKQDEIRKLTLRNRVLFARRHCPDALKVQLKLSMAWQRLTAILSGNKVMLEAFREADIRWNEYNQSR